MGVDCQGDVFREIEYYEKISENNGCLELQKIIFPYVVVLTQDCDLAQDYSSRNAQRKDSKLLFSVLIAPMYNAEHVFAGEHLSELDITASLIKKKKTEGEKLMKNELPRYHYIEFPEETQIIPSIIDFKHYFSVPVNYLLSEKEHRFVCKVASLYREDISHRFSFFLSRIGLPEK